CLRLFASKPGSEARRVAGGQVERLETRRIREQAIKAEHLFLKVLENLLDAAAIRDLLRADRKLDGTERIALAIMREVLIAADCRQPAKIEYRVGRQPLDEFCQQKRFLHGQHRREDGGDCTPLFLGDVRQFTSQCRNPALPRGGRKRTAVELGERLLEAILAVDVGVIESAFV